MRSFFRFIVTLLIVGAIFSCNNNTPEPTNNYYGQIIKNDKGIVRGVNLNDKIELIKAQENGEAIIAETATIIEYEYPLDNGGTYVVAYNFDGDGCFEIDIDTYFNTEAPAQEVLNIMKTYFDKKFKQAEQDEGLYIWKNEDKSTTIELDYLNQADGEIMLTIFANE